MSAIPETRAPGGRFADRMLDLLFPPQCLSCDAIVDRPGTLCATCWGGIAFIGSPRCAVCGLPFDFDQGEDAQCGVCLRDPPPYGRARAVLRYDAASRDLVLGFKYRDRTYAASAYAGWMARAGAELAGAADLVLPVPLHRLRLFRRRYNQAALLALALGRANEIPVATDLLVRRRNTRPMGGLSPAQRARNLRGAFAVRPNRGARLRGKRVLLIDDVMTTGATVGACARTLIGAGAGAVDVLTLARVVRPTAG